MTSSEEYSDSEVENKKKKRPASGSGSERSDRSERSGTGEETSDGEDGTDNSEDSSEGSVKAPVTKKVVESPRKDRSRSGSEAPNDSTEESEDVRKSPRDESPSDGSEDSEAENKRVRAGSGSQRSPRRDDDTDGSSYDGSRRSADRPKGRHNYDERSDYTETDEDDAPRRKDVYERDRERDPDDERSVSEDSVGDDYGSVVDDPDDDRERNVQRRRFAELPQARLYDERRNYDDPYCKGLHNHIQQLSHHIMKIQDKEIELLASFSSGVFGRDKGLELDKENKKREEAIADIGEVRRERTKYRGMLYDAIQDRNNLLESREISRREERFAKNRADRIDPWNGLDLFLLIFLLAELAIIILYIIFMDFTNTPLDNGSLLEIIGPVIRLDYYYNYWVDIAFFIFVGLTLMTAFLRKYHYSAIGFTFLVAAFAFQWALLWNGFFEWAAPGIGHRAKIKLECDDIIRALYTTATVVVGYGAIVGRASPLQSIFFSFFLTFFQSLNYYICIWVLKAVDNGGAMTIHMFGAFFGVAASWISGFLDNTKYTKDYDDRDRVYPWNNHQRPSYFGEIWAFIGTLFVFVFFPSFNTAFATQGQNYLFYPTSGQAQGRVAVNTVLALTVSGIVTFILSWVFHWNHFHPFEIQNGAIVGGVLLGSGHSLIINGYEAMFVALAGTPVCYLGLRFITLWMNNPERIPILGSRRIGTRLWGKIPRDTRGVLFSHGVAGWIGGLASIIAIAAYDGDQRFGQPYYQQFHTHINQAARNVYCWLISWFLPIASGIVVGFGMWLIELLIPSERFPGVRRPRLRKYHDEVNWREVPLDIDY